MYIIRIMLLAATASLVASAPVRAREGFAPKDTIQGRGQCSNDLKLTAREVVPTATSDRPNTEWALPTEGRRGYNKREEPSTDGCGGYNKRQLSLSAGCGTDARGRANKLTASTDGRGGYNSIDNED